MGRDDRRSTPRPEYDRGRHLFSLGLASCTVVLLAAGGLVTSTGSGLAVPDWPLSFGQVFPPMAGGVLYEHGHRLVAAAVGLLTFAALVWHLRRERRAWVRGLACAAFAAVVVQGLLGGLTVLLRLPPLVSVAHACLAQAFFALVVVLAQATSRAFVARAPEPLSSEGRPRLAVLAGLAASLVYGQLVLGAVMRHTGAGLAIPDVPLAFGRFVPPLLSREIAVHFAHRVVAVVIALCVGWVAALSFRHPERPDLRRPALLAAVLVAAQILLGGASVLTRLAVVPTTAHLVCGALILAALLVLALRAARGASVLRGAAMVREPGTLDDPHGLPA
jgi:cytochrome c oxidase assembly protein subunit 15